MEELSALKEQAEKYFKNYTSYKELAESYAKYIVKMEELVKEISSAVDNLSASKTFFLNGGYIDGNETLDRGKISLFIKTLEDVASKISSVISNTIIRKDDYISKATEYLNLYYETLNEYRVKKI